VRIAGDDAVFDVADTGVGIAPEDLERIFEPFWQVESRLAHRTSGTGLGLAVSRRLAHLLGGDIAVESNPGIGTTFHVCIRRDGGVVNASPEDDVPEEPPLLPTFLGVAGSGGEQRDTGRPGEPGAAGDRSDGSERDERGGVNDRDLLASASRPAGAG
jgi:hypothetical protein